MANSFSLYHELKTIGFEDDHMIVMNALDSYCDLRNPFPGDIFADNSIQSNSVYNENMEIDFVGEDVNFQTIYELLSGRYSSYTPLSKRLRTNSNSNIFIFLSGHGGDQFFKFQDYEEISSDDLYVLFYEMKLKGRYKNLLFLVDTCQASTLTDKMVNLPGFISLSSSKKDENSYAYITNNHLGITVIDRFTYSLLKFLRRYNSKDLSQKSVEELYSSFQRNFLHSTPILHISSPNEKQHFLNEFFDSTEEVRLVEKRTEIEFDEELVKTSIEIVDLYNNLLLEL
jgi:GPI-anchor transamidase subunit K